MKKKLYCILGVFMVVLGTIGILMPLLPTTPFLLLAAWLFAQSSEQLNQWLLNQRYLGPYIHAFRSKQGLTVNQKFRIGLSMTLMMAVGLYFSPVVVVKYVVAGIWLFWCFMLYRMKTAEPSGWIDP